MHSSTSFTGLTVISCTGVFRSPFTACSLGGEGFDGARPLHTAGSHTRPLGRTHLARGPTDTWLCQPRYTSRKRLICSWPPRPSQVWRGLRPRKGKQGFSFRSREGEPQARRAQGQRDTGKGGAYPLYLPNVFGLTTLVLKKKHVLLETLAQKRQKMHSVKDGSTDLSVTDCCEKEKINESER